MDVENDTFKVGFSIKSKHGVIYKYIVDNDLTVKGMAQILDVSIGWLGSVLNFSFVPKTNTITPSIKKLLTFFNCDFYDMFPSRNIQLIAGNKVVFQNIPKEKLINLTCKEFAKLPAPETEININKEQLKIQMNKTLATLNIQQEKVIKLRFGIDCNKRHTLNEIGKLIGVTQERVRQIESVALRKLRHPTRKKMIYKNIYKD